MGAAARCADWRSSATLKASVIQVLSMRGRLRASATLGVFALVLQACGGKESTPAAPTAVATPAPTPTPSPVLVDGLSGATVSGATVTTTASGLSIRAAGYRTPRETIQRTGTIVLWPTMQTPGYFLPDDYVDTLVYQGGTGRLFRFTGPIVLSLGTGLAGSAEAAAMLERVAAAIPRVPGLPPVSIGANGNVVFQLGNPGPDALARCEYRTRGFEIVGADLVFGTRDIALGGPPRGNTPIHEMAHSLGLPGHSERAADVLSVGGRRDGSWNFSGDETALLTMMYAHRKIGHRPPDRDPEITALARPQRFSIHCPR